MQSSTAVSRCQLLLVLKHARLKYVQVRNVLHDGPPVISNNKDWVLRIEGNLGKLGLLHNLLLAKSILLVCSQVIDMHLRSKTMFCLWMRPRRHSTQSSLTPLSAWVQTY